MANANSKFFNATKDLLNPSINTVPSTKAVKDALDEKQDANLAAGKKIIITEEQRNTWLDHRNDPIDPYIYGVTYDDKGTIEESGDELTISYILASDSVFVSSTNPNIENLSINKTTFKDKVHPTEDITFTFNYIKDDSEKTIITGKGSAVFMGVNDPTDPDYDVWVNPTGDAAIGSIDIKNALGYIPLDRAYVDEKVVGTETNPKEPEEDNLLLGAKDINEKIATASGNFRGTFETVEEIEALPNPENNEYAMLQRDDPEHPGQYINSRYKYSEKEGAWLFEYNITGSSLNQEQLDALNSGITYDLVHTTYPAYQTQITLLNNSKEERLTSDNAGDGIEIIRDENDKVLISANIPDGVLSNISESSTTITVSGATSPIAQNITYNTVMGIDADSEITQATVIGWKAKAKKLHSSSTVGRTVAVGSNATGTLDSVAVGDSAHTYDEESVTVGSNAVTLTNSRGAIAIGYQAWVGVQAYEGITEETCGKNSIQLGTGRNMHSNTFQVWEYKLLDKETGYIPQARTPYFVKQYPHLGIGYSYDEGEPYNWHGSDAEEPIPAGEIVQYVGPTTAGKEPAFVNGYFYINSDTPIVGKPYFTFRSDDDCPNGKFFCLDADKFEDIIGKSQRPETIKLQRNSGSQSWNLVYQKPLFPNTIETTLQQPFVTIPNIDPDDYGLYLDKNSVVVTDPTQTITIELHFVRPDKYLISCSNDMKYSEEGSLHEGFNVDLPKFKSKTGDLYGTYEFYYNGNNVWGLSITYPDGESRSYGNIDLEDYGATVLTTKVIPVRNNSYFTIDYYHDEDCGRCGWQQINTQPKGQGGGGGEGSRLLEIDGGASASKYLITQGVEGGNADSTYTEGDIIDGGNASGEKEEPEPEE